MLFKELVETFKLNAVEHETHGHGPPNLLANIDFNFSAGPNFNPNKFVRWSSVSNGKPEPSICWSRNFCK